MSDQADLAAILSKGSCSWASIEMRVETNYPRSKPRSNNFSWMKVSYIERATGERYYEHISRSTDGKMSRSEDYSDGKKFTSISYDGPDNRVQKQVTYPSSFGREADIGVRHCPYPLRIFRVGHEPLAEMLPKGKGLGPSTVLDRPCLRFEFGGFEKGIGRSRVVVYHLDRETGVPLKIERIFADDRKIVWEALSLDKVQGRHFLLHSRLLNFDGEVQHEYNVIELKYDAKHDEKMFVPIISPRARVIGALAPGQDGALSAASSARGLGAAPGSGGLAEASSPSLGLGAVAVFAVFLARARRSRRRLQGIDHRGMPNPAVRGGAAG